MEDEINQQVQEEVLEEKPPRAEIRNKDLSEKVITTAKERDDALAKATAAEKEVEFYKGFSKVSSKYPDAVDYQDKILEKVNSGYDIEDATTSILIKAGKFNAPQVERQSPAGGSASTSMRSADDKPLNEMTQAEKRDKLLQMDREDPGSLSRTLKTISL